MKTVSIVASLSRNAGGLFESVCRLNQCLAEIPNVRVRVLGLRDRFTEVDSPAWSPLNLKAFSTWGPWQFGYSPSFKRDLLEQDEDILHTNGLWMYPSVVTRDWHRTTGRPYLISPHGMLDPWAVKNSALKKKLAQIFFEREHLENAACIRALCPAEAVAIRTFGLKNPICIISNGIDVPEIKTAETMKTEKLKSTDCPPPWTGSIEPGRKVLLYLGRIHPKKGLANLLRAWSQVQSGKGSALRTSEWVLAIAGWDQGGHEGELKRLCDELGIAWKDIREHRTSNIEHPTSSDQRAEGGGQRAEKSVVSGPSSVVFLGPEFGDDKAACYLNCDAFILPSVSEGLPMVVLEAWAYGKPVLMTPECNLPEGFAANAAIRIEPSVESIAQGLRELFQTPSAKRQALGDHGRALVAEKFAWPKIAADMKSVYDWVLGGGARPECVQIKS